MQFEGWLSVVARFNAARMEHLKFDITFCVMYRRVGRGNRIVLIRDFVLCVVINVTDVSLRNDGYL